MFRMMCLFALIWFASRIAAAFADASSRSNPSFLGLSRDVACAFAFAFAAFAFARDAANFPSCYRTASAVRFGSWIALFTPRPPITPSPAPPTVTASGSRDLGAEAGTDWYCGYP